MERAREQPRPTLAPSQALSRHFQRAGRAGEAAQDAARHRGADDEGEVASEVAVVLRDEAAVLEAGVQLHCEVLGEDERLDGKQGRYGPPEHLPTGPSWPRLEAALSLVWRRRGVLEANWPKPLAAVLTWTSASSARSTRQIVSNGRPVASMNVTVPM